MVSRTGKDDPRWKQGAFDAVFGAIQDAVDAANHCDTIIVRPGTYREYLSIEEKDVKIYSDTWNDAGTVEDGNERLKGFRTSWATPAAKRPIEASLWLLMISWEREASVVLYRWVMKTKMIPEKQINRRIVAMMMV